MGIILLLLLAFMLPMSVLYLNVDFAGMVDKFFQKYKRSEKNTVIRPSGGSFGNDEKKMARSGLVW
jgi:hypothetical protein